MNCGVPQGSCLGPLLFTIYTRSLLDVVQDYLPSVRCYADDTQLYVSFSPADMTGHSAAITAIEHCIQVIRNWMHENKLLLNEAKTEFLRIGTKEQLAKVNILYVKVGSANIACILLLKVLEFGLTQTYLWWTISTELVLQRSIISTKLGELEST